MIKTLHESSLNILYLQDTQNETQFPEKLDSGEKPVVDLANYRAFFRYKKRPIKKEEFYFLWNIYITQEMVVGRRRGLKVVKLRENLSMYLSGDLFLQRTRHQCLHHPPHRSDHQVLSRHRTEHKGRLL